MLNIGSPPDLIFYNKFHLQVHYSLCTTACPLQSTGQFHCIQVLSGNLHSDKFLIGRCNVEI